MRAAAKEGPETPPAETPKKVKKKPVRKKDRLPQKRTMNLYYKPDRTTKPATVTLYVLFVLAGLLGLGKLLVYDLWVETEQARQELIAAEDEMNGVMLQLADYNEVKERYQRYAATEEEQAVIDRMEVLELLESAVMPVADIETVSISGDSVQLSFSGVTLAQTARIVQALEASPIVAGTTVNTAATKESEAGRPVQAVQAVRANILIELQKREAAE